MLFWFERQELPFRKGKERWPWLRQVTEPYGTRWHKESVAFAHAHTQWGCVILDGDQGDNRGREGISPRARVVRFAERSLSTECRIKAERDALA